MIPTQDNLLGSKYLVTGLEVTPLSLPMRVTKSIYQSLCNPTLEHHLDSQMVLMLC